MPSYFPQGASRSYVTNVAHFHLVHFNVIIICQLLLEVLLMLTHVSFEGPKHSEV